jgi:hypothetical protein
VQRRAGMKRTWTLVVGLVFTAEGAEAHRHNHQQM